MQHDSGSDLHGIVFKQLTTEPDLAHLSCDGGQFAFGRLQPTAHITDRIPHVGQITTRAPPYLGVLLSQLRDFQPGAFPEFVDFLLDSGMIINDIATLDQIKGGFITPQRFSMLLLSIFAGVAIVLAAAGIYGVMSYSVSQRTQEIGVRRALGAEAGDLRSMVVRQGLKLIAIGLGIGLVVAVAFTRTLGHLLWGVTATDPVTIGAVILILATVRMLACYLPALRATRIDPVAALRYE
jgi:hypothetical protein